MIISRQMSPRNKQGWKRVPGVSVLVEPSSDERTFPLRERYRQEVNCRIVHDSIHSLRGRGSAEREGGRWSNDYRSFTTSLFCTR